MKGTDARIALGCVLSAMAATAAAGDWPQVPLPQGSSVGAVAGHMVYNGLDMRPQTFRSRAAPQDLLAFYERAWGPRRVVNTLADGSQIVGHREGDYYITVQLRAAGRGSEGTIGVVDLASAPDAPPELGKGLPRPQGTHVFNDIAYPDDPVPARTVAMRNTLSVRQNAQWFQERLQGEGWKPADANRCRDDGCVQRYERGDSKLTLVLSGAGGQSQIVLNELQP
jgi:hypothetical protein